jgi:hypothetical protein
MECSSITLSNELSLKGSLLSSDSRAELLVLDGQWMTPCRFGIK